jgi:beta-lactam-binding protein with PASTA domain
MTTGPLTTAEKKVQAKTGVRPGTGPVRVPQNAPQRRSAAVANVVSQESDVIRRAQQRRRTEEQKKQEERNRVATTAVVICSAVGVIAIIIFLVAIFNGFLLNREKDLVEVPYLEGKTYSEDFLAKYRDFNIRLLPQQYHDTYYKDQIISQEPAGGEEVQRGSDIWITISMGTEPPLTKLDDLVGVDGEEAYEALKNQGFNPLKRREPSYIYESGLVTRTDPAARTELAPGDTVYLYISTGPEIVERPMPNVVGLDVDRAEELLTGQGFVNVRYEKMESQKPMGQVIYQSVSKNVEVDVEAEIIIHYSEGPKETEAPVEATTEPVDVGQTQPQEVEFTASFTLPEREEEYRLDICISGTKDVVASQMISPGTSSAMVQLTGRGTVYYDLYINGVFECEKKVTITDD